MAIAMNNAALRFRINFDVPNQLLIFTDLIQAAYNTTYGMVLANVKGIIKVTDPLGGIYQNAGWTTVSFASPDIDGATLDWTKIDIDMLVDSDGIPVNGTYTLEYYLTNGVTNYYISKSYDFQYISPVVEIEMQAICRTSQLSSEDVTEYTVDSIEPTITRTHHIVKPEGSDFTTPADTADAYRLIGGGDTKETVIWTNIWQTTISSILVYNMEYWGISIWIVVNDTVTGYDSLDAQCDDCACHLRPCINTLVTRYQSYKDTNPVEAAKLKEYLFMTGMKWMQFEFSERCGEDYSIYCAEIKAILATADCFCLTESDTSTRPIWPWGAGEGVSISVDSGWTAGTAAPTGGTPGIGYIQYTGVPPAITDCVIWIKSGGTWTKLGSVFGGTGATGADATPVIILYSDSSDYGTDAGTLEKDLIVYTLLGDSLADSGDMAHVTALVQLASNGRGKTLKLYFGGDVTAQFFTDSETDTDNNIVKMEMWISRTGATSQFYDSLVMRNGLFKPAIGTAAKDCAVNIDIKVTGQNSETYANDIVLKHFRVELIKAYIAP